MTELMVNPNEQAIEAGQISRPGPADQPRTCVACFEPQTLTDVLRQGRLYVLAEGIGGTASAHAAAHFAAQTVIHAFYTSATTDPRTRLEEAVQQANSAIFARNAEHPDRRPLAAAFTAALIHNHRLLVANVGDQRVYVVWDQDIELLNKSAAADAAESPVLVLSPKSDTPEPEPAPESFSERLPAGLGLAQSADIQFFSRRMFSGDIAVLLSGGLTGYLQERELTRALNLHSPEQAILRLIALATERGCHDHVGISVMRVLSAPLAKKMPAPMTLPPAPRWEDFEIAPAPGSQASTTDTQPMASPPAKTQFSRPPDLMKPRPKIPWLPIAGTLAALLLLCVATLAAARYFASPEMLATLPLPDSLRLAAPAEPQIKLLPSPTPTAGPPTNTPLPASPTVAGSANSPLSTPAAEAAAVSPLNTPTPARAADVISVLPTPTATPTPLPLPTIELPAGCENRGRFVRDVTIPDGTVLAAGEKFEKAWLVLNAEDCPWGPGYTVRLTDGDSMGAPEVVLLREVAEPGDNFEIRIPMTAPASPGTHRSTWQLHDLAGEPFGPDLFLEIEVTPPDISAAAGGATLFDFVAAAPQARWSSGGTIYNVSRVDINEQLPLPVPQGLVAVGPALLRGNKTSAEDALLTYPDRESGFIEGVYRVDTPLQPTDAVAATLGFTKLSILSDDGVTFEVSFTPDGGEERLLISAPVQYRDSPVTQLQPLGEIPAGTAGTFTLRVLGGQSLSQDWAVWINARLIRPEAIK